MEIFFAILAGIFSIAASVFGVRNRIRGGARSNTKRDLRDEGSGYNGPLSDSERLERDQERLQERDERIDEQLQRVNDISSRIRKKEQPTDSSE